MLSPVKKTKQLSVISRFIDPDPAPVLQKQ